jgi:hypothetical protein
MSSFSFGVHNLRKGTTTLAERIRDVLLETGITVSLIQYLLWYTICPSLRSFVAELFMPIKSSSLFTSTNIDANSALHTFEYMKSHFFVLTLDLRNSAS